MIKKLFKILKNYLITLLLPIVFFLLILLARPETVKISQMGLIFQQAIIPAVLAWGLYFNITVGNWDFSLGAIALIAGIISYSLAMMFQLHLFFFLILCIIIGTLLGMINAALFHLTRIPTLIISIGMLFILESLSSIIFGGGGVLAKQEWVIFGVFPYNAIAGIVFFSIALLFYKFHRFGYQVRAVGLNSAVAQNHGISVYGIKVKALIIAGFFAGGYAFLTLCSNGIYSPASGMTTTSVVFDAMMCFYVGMVLSKLTDCIFATYIGSVFLQMIKLSILVLGFNTTYQRVFISLMVLFLIAINSSEKGIINILRMKITRKEAN